MEMFAEKPGMLPVSSGGIAIAAGFGEQLLLVGRNTLCVV
jgi:hypothetical protein